MTPRTSCSPRSRKLPWLLLLLALVLPLASCSQEWHAGKQTAMVPMADGVRLATDVWLPEGDGPWPVAMARTPYNKDGIKGEGQNSSGIAVVVQDVRGRFASEGEARPFVADGWGEHRDGFDTANWVVDQPWCNGRIATFGGSAVGLTQYLLAGTDPPGLVACYAVVACASLYNGGFFEGGAFRKSLIERWYALAQWPDYAMEEPLAHPTYDDHWRTMDLRTRAGFVKCPIMHVGGWHDIFTQGTIEAFQALQERGGEGARSRQHLVMGPWSHGVKRTEVGQLQFPPNAQWPDGAPDEARWMTSFLLGDGAEMDALPTVWYYVMGDVDAPDAPGNVWRTADSWPPPATETRLYLTEARGLAGSAPPDGRLTYRYDPQNPVPTVGGRNLVLPSGPHDQRSVESRNDVLVFSTPILDEPVEVTGQVSVRLTASSSATDTDFTGKLTDVYPDGRSMLIADSIIRARFRDGLDRETLMRPGEVYEFAIDLGSTSIIFNRGHRIRLAISSSNSPRYEPNPNTGEPWRASDETQVADQTVYVGGERASCVLLPVVQSEPGGEAG